jgi:hypothetical protein
MLAIIYIRKSEKTSAIFCGRQNFAGWGEKSVRSPHRKNLDERI